MKRLEAMFPRPTTKQDVKARTRSSELFLDHDDNLGRIQNVFIKPGVDFNLD